ncbi:MAG TPA: hypothetical protein VHE60_03905 [Pyrinomonadaceae bacterium]|nr:hypothetical protein [Pyrinomonadaceae bacterium]
MKSLAQKRWIKAVARSFRLPKFILHPSSFILVFAVLASVVHFATSLRAQIRPPRSGAHSAAAREVFTPADRALVERAIGATCAERVRDPLGSVPIDEMQTRPSLPAGNPDAIAGARRAERLLPTTKKLVANAIIELAKDYDFFGTAANRARVNAATSRVEAVRRIKPDVDSRDNASVLLRDPRVIDFGTIFLAGLRSDEGMVSVLAHELTHIASGQADSLRPLFRAIARRAAARTGLRIQGQRAEELGCDLVGVMAARAFIKQTPSWEPLPRRLARAFEHNCVDDDASDEDHLSPRNTIRALFALDVSLASEEVSDGGTGASWIVPRLPFTRPTLLTASTRSS